VADLRLNKEMLKAVVRKNGGACRFKEGRGVGEGTVLVSERRACKLFAVDRERGRCTTNIRLTRTKQEIVPCYVLTFVKNTLPSDKDIHFAHG